MTTLDEWKNYVYVAEGEDPSYCLPDALKIAQREGVLFAYAENGAFVDLRWREKDPTIRVHISVAKEAIFDHIKETCPNLKQLKAPEPVVNIDNPDPLDPRGLEPIDVTTPELKAQLTEVNPALKSGATIPSNINFSIAALKLLEEYGAKWPAGVEGTGKEGAVTKKDVELLLGI